MPLTRHTKGMKIKEFGNAEFLCESLRPRNAHFIAQRLCVSSFYLFSERNNENFYVED